MNGTEHEARSAKKHETWVGGGALTSAQELVDAKAEAPEQEAGDGSDVDRTVERGQSALAPKRGDSWAKGGVGVGRRLHERLGDVEPDVVHLDAHEGGLLFRGVQPKDGLLEVERHDHAVAVARYCPRTADFDGRNC